MNHLLAIQKLKEEVKRELADGCICLVCHKRMNGEEAYLQWEKNYRILCPDCEEVEVKREQRYYPGDPSDLPTKQATDPGTVEKIQNEIPF